MTDRELTEILRRTIAWSDQRRHAGADPGVSAMILTAQLRLILGRVERAGFERVPRLIRDLASQGGAFPPSASSN